MLKTVTLDKFRDAIAAEQKPFFGIPTLPTFFGILALTIVIIDTYLNAIGKNGFSVSLINSIFGSIHYPYLLFSVIILQFIFLYIAFSRLRHLSSIPWNSPISYANQNTWLVYLFIFTLAVPISWGLSHTISVSSNLKTIASVPGDLLEIIFAFFVCIAIAIIANSFIKALRHDLSLSVGIIFGIVICAVSYILTPTQVQVIVDLQSVRDNVISEQTAITTTGLKVRENPDSQSSKLIELSKGDLVVLLGKEAQATDGGAWVLVSNNNTKGWVNKKFLSINPPSTKVSKTTNNSSERVYLSEINQFRYWQSGIFFATIISFAMFFLLIKFKNRTYETIFQLDLDKDETGTSFYEHSPSGLDLAAPIYVKILAQNQLIIAFSRGINSNSYNLLDIRNNQSIIPLHDGSIIIWNISKIKERINESFATVDSLNFFSFTGSIGFLTTTISYHDPSKSFDQSTIDFISEIFFKKSNDLQNIIKGALYSTFEEFISPLRIDINEISSEVDTSNLFEVNIDDTKYQSDGYKNYKQEELKDIQSKAQSLKNKINDNIKSLKDIRNKTGEFAANLANSIVDKIIINIISDRIAQVRLSGNFINETKRVLLMLGFRISEANLKILDTNCENKLRELQQKIEDRLKEIKKEYDAARIKEEEVDIELYKHYFEIIVRILENPLLGREEKLNLIKAMPYRRAMEIYRNLTHDDPSIISKQQPKTLIQIENDDNTEGPT